MASLNQRGGKLYFDFRWQGTRYREYSDLPDTAGNRKKAQAVLKHLEADIRKGVFDLATYFPDSPRLNHSSAPLRAPMPPTAAVARPLGPAEYAQPITPRFQDFAEDWFDEMKPQWRTSYKKNIRLTLDAHLIPEFGDHFLANITKSDILEFD